jgi:hypothetical protein
MKLEALKSELACEKLKSIYVARHCFLSQKVQLTGGEGIDHAIRQSSWMGQHSSPISMADAVKIDDASYSLDLADTRPVAKAASAEIKCLTLGCEITRRCTRSSVSRSALVKRSCYRKCSAHEATIKVSRYRLALSMSR